MMEHLLLQIRKYKGSPSSNTNNDVSITMMTIFQIRPHQRRKLSSLSVSTFINNNSGCCCGSPTSYYQWRNSKSGGSCCSCRCCSRSSSSICSSHSNTSSHHSNVTKIEYHSHHHHQHQLLHHQRQPQPPEMLYHKMQQIRCFSIKNNGSIDNIANNYNNNNDSNSITDSHHHSNSSLTMTLSNDPQPSQQNRLPIKKRSALFSSFFSMNNYNYHAVPSLSTTSAATAVTASVSSSFRPTLPVVADVTMTTPSDGRSNINSKKNSNNNNDTASIDQHHLPSLSFSSSFASTTDLTRKKTAVPTTETTRTSLLQGFSDVIHQSFPEEGEYEIQNVQNTVRKKETPSNHSVRQFDKNPQQRQKRRQQSTATSDHNHTRVLCDDLKHAPYKSRILGSQHYVSEPIQYTSSTGIISVGWTSIFTCPSSGIKYPSGLLLEHSADIVQVAHEPCFSDANQGVVKTGAVYYRTQDLAQKAARQLALDRMQYRKHGISSPRSCSENPSIITDCSTSMGEQQHQSQLSLPLLPQLVSDSQLRDTSLAFKLLPAVNKNRSQKTLRNSSSITDNHNGEKECDIVSNNQNDTFITTDSPFFPVANHSPDKEKEQILSLEPFLMDESVLPNVNIPTVAVSAIDSSVRTSDNDTNHDVGNDNTTIEVPQLDQDIHNLLIGMIDYVDDDRGSNEDDDEYELRTDIVSFGVAPPAQQLLEYSFRLDVGKKSGKVNGKKEDDDDSFSKTKSLNVKSPESVITVAESWLNGYKSANTTTAKSDKDSKTNTENPHRLILPRTESSMKKFVLAKQILSSLAEAAQRTPTGSSSLIIESVAKKVLDMLWRSDNCLPDADSYTYFLLSLDGTNPTVAVEKAETIVGAMKNEEKHKTNSHTLPTPNQGTYNALIQLTAQIGGISGRYPKFTDYVSDFIPDRQSFMSILSSCIYAPTIELQKGGFDREFVDECIVSMNALAKEQKNDHLIPNTYVYNAPLRWSGGPVLWTQCRPYTRIIPWDNYGKIYSNGVKEETLEDNNLVQQARGMDAWLDMMEIEGASNKQIVPNVETYEAVIQGWLRTGTREGLDRANALLQKLLEDSETDPSLKPRLQTFHPVLASLYHSQLDDNLEKIIYFINEWEKLSSDADEPLDERLVRMKLTTLLQKQKKIFLDQQHEKVGEICHDLKSNALLCSKIVNDACTAIERKAKRDVLDDQSLELSSFTVAVRAWGYVADKGLEREDSKMTYEALSEAISLLIGFENVIKGIMPSQGLTLRSPLKAQLDHMVLHGHRLFSHVASLLSKHHVVNDQPEVILLFEKMTRIVGEFSEVEAKGMGIEDNVKMDKMNRFHSTEKRRIPKDHFDYRFKLNEAFVSERNHSFLWHVVLFLDKVPIKTTNISDVVRLCHLVKDIGSTRRRSQRLNADVDKILHRLHSNFVEESSPKWSNLRKETKNNNNYDKKPNMKILPKAKPVSVKYSPRRRPVASSNTPRKKINGVKINGAKINGAKINGAM